MIGPSPCSVRHEFVRDNADGRDRSFRDIFRRRLDQCFESSGQAPHKGARWKRETERTHRRLPCRSVGNQGRLRDLLGGHLKLAGAACHNGRAALRRQYSEDKLKVVRRGITKRSLDVISSAIHAWTRPRRDGAGPTMQVGRHAALGLTSAEASLERSSSVFFSSVKVSSSSPTASVKPSCCAQVFSVP